MRLVIGGCYYVYIDQRRSMAIECLHLYLKEYNDIDVSIVSVYAARK